MTNVRGNEYSKAHMTLDTCSSCKDYWSFGLEEPAKFDYPASIDYILNLTRQDDLFYVGYSMGSSHYFIMLSELPEYNDKIKAGFVMAPAVFLGNSSLPLRLGKPLYNYLFSFFEWIGFQEVMTKSIAALSHYTCTKDTTHASYCQMIWTMVGNSDTQELDMKSAVTHMSNIPSGSSLKTYKHFAQLLDGTFTKFSYDSRTNMKLYGSKIAPEYELNNVKTPTRMYVGRGDPLTTVKDVQKLSASLPNSMGIHVVDRPEWNHLDFAFSSNANELVFSHLISDMNKFQAQTVSAQNVVDCPQNSTSVMNVH